MKVFVRCLISAFLAGFCITSYAQSPSAAIHGKVVFEDHSPAASATIILLDNSDSSAVKSVVADKAGQYNLAELEPGQYLLLVTVIGYTTSYYGPYDVGTAQTVNVPDIILNIAPKQLKTVTVTGSRPEIEVTPGKTTLNVQNSILDDGKSAYDILRSSPGVRVDNTTISIVGHQNALILINGKQTSLSGEDLVNILRGMQSNTIDRIELLTGGSAKYDASGGGIINIITRKGKNTGVNGVLTGGAGYGKYYKDNAGIIFNDGTAKFNVFGSYNYNDNKTFHDFTNDRTIDFNNAVSRYNTDYNSTQKRTDNVFSFGTDYYLS